MKSMCDLDSTLAQLGVELTQEMINVGIDNPNWASWKHRFQLTMRVKGDKLGKVLRLIELCDVAASQIEQYEE